MTCAGASFSVSIWEPPLARELIYSTDPVATRIDELQFTIGEGPCLDAFRHQKPHTVANLIDTSAATRWPVFTTAVVEELEVRAVFAFPIAVGGVPLGSLELYRAVPGTLSIEQHRAAAGIAAMVEPALIAEAGGDHAAGDDGPGSAHMGSGESGSVEFSRSEVHTASRMLAARLGIPIDDASARLREYAYARGGQPVTAVARTVVRRTLDPRTFDDA